MGTSPLLAFPTIKWCKINGEGDPAPLPSLLTVGKSFQISVRWRPDGLLGERPGCGHGLQEGVEDGLQQRTFSYAGAETSQDPAILGFWEKTAVSAEMTELTESV